MGRITPTGARSSIPRRTLLKAGLAWTAGAMAVPFPIRARAEMPVKIGMVEPLTGVYATLAESEVAGARFAVERVNQSGGILGRQVELLVADSANDIAAGVHKTRELIDRDQVDFITGNVNSAVALAMTQVTAEKRKLHIVTGAHIDEITGGRCSWNVFRICKTTSMEVNAIADTLVEKFGRKVVLLTPDYIYGRSLQAAFERKLHQHGGKSAASMLPIGTHDYSRALSDAATYQPQVLVDLMGGEDQANSLRQIVRSGLERKHGRRRGAVRAGEHSGGPRRGADRLVDHGMVVGFQPNVPQIKAFDAAIRSRTSKAASARHWFGYAAVRTIVQVANQEKSLDPVVLARALQGYTLPADIALDANRAFFRDRDHELMSTILIGQVHPARDDPFDVFTVQAAVEAEEAAGPTRRSDCQLAFPS